MAKAAKKTAKKAAKKAAKVLAKKAAPKKTPKSKVKLAAKRKAAKPTKKAAPKTSLKAVQKSSLKSKDYSRVFSPLDDRVLVLKSGVSNRTPGGLYIPDSVSGEGRPLQGSVVAVGPGHRDKKGRLQPLDVRIGDTVMFNSYNGSEVKIDSNELLCLRESEIIAIVKD